MSNQTIVLLLVAITVLLVLLAFAIIIMGIRLSSGQKLLSGQKTEYTDFSPIEGELDRVQIRISKMVHDQLLQVACMVNWDVSAIEKGDATGIIMMKDHLNTLISSAQKICISLNSDYIRSQTLVSLINHELESVQKGKILCELKSEGEERILPYVKKVLAYRIVEDAINNVVQHSMAATLNVTIHYLETHVQIKVCDDGMGIPGERMHAHPSTGIAAMRERTKMLRGTLEIVSERGLGCEVMLSFSDL